MIHDTPPSLFERWAGGFTEICNPGVNKGLALLKIGLAIGLSPIFLGFMAWDACFGGRRVVRLDADASECIELVNRIGQMTLVEVRQPNEAIKNRLNRLLANKPHHSISKDLLLMNYAFNKVYVSDSKTIDSFVKNIKNEKNLSAKRNKAEMLWAITDNKVTTIERHPIPNQEKSEKIWKDHIKVCQMLRRIAPEFHHEEDEYRDLITLGQNEIPWNFSPHRWYQDFLRKKKVILSHASKPARQSFLRKVESHPIYSILNAIEQRNIDRALELLSHLQPSEKKKVVWEIARNAPLKLAIRLLKDKALEERGVIPAGRWLEVLSDRAAYEGDRREAVTLYQSYFDRGVANVQPVVKDAMRLKLGLLYQIAGKDQEALDVFNAIQSEEGMALEETERVETQWQDRYTPGLLRHHIYVSDLSLKRMATFCIGKIYLMQGQYGQAEQMFEACGSEEMVMKSRQRRLESHSTNPLTRLFCYISPGRFLHRQLLHLDPRFRGLQILWWEEYARPLSELRRSQESG